MNNDITDWFTTENGVHVPIRHGETKLQAMNRQFNNKNSVKSSTNQNLSNTPTKLNVRVEDNGGLGSVIYFEK